MRIQAIVILTIGFLLVSCSGTKHLADGEVLFKGSNIKIAKVGNEKDWEIKDEGHKLTSLYWELWDTPNGAILGLPALSGLPYRLLFYNWFYTNKAGTFKRWMMENFGESPITIQKVNPQLKVEKGINIYENYGHFGTMGSYDLKFRKNNKKAFINYRFQIPQAYTYRNIIFRADTTQRNISKLLHDYQRITALRSGDDFNLDKIRKEKTNLWNQFQNSGFYYISENDLIIAADTTVSQKQLDLEFKVSPKPSPFSDKRETINDFSLIIDSVKQLPNDSKYYFWDFGKIRKSMIHKFVPIAPGDTFSLAKTRKSVRYLNDLGVFANPRINYAVLPNDSTKLNAKLTMDPLKATTIALKLDGNYQNTGYLGPAIGLNLTQLNVFGGAENFTLDGDAYYDFPIGAFKERVSNSSGFSLRSQLSAPLLRTPFHFIKSNESLPRKFIALNFNFNDRKDYFTLLGFNASYGISWKSGKYSSHRIELINATYSDILNTTQRFDSVLVDNPSLRSSLVDQFILGTSYRYRIDKSNIENKRLGFSFEGGAEFSGNILGLAHSIAGIGSYGSRKFLGIKYSQYALFQYDFRAYLKVGMNNQLVFRNQAGIGLSYGNSTQMPYIKKFFIGGSNSLRPINARSVGPGRYIELDEAEVNQVGDIKIEWNLEYRIKLGVKLSGAIWSDMGNIFLLEEDPNRPYSQIRWNKIFSDSYLTTGLGLRLDLKYLLLRADYGVVLYAPIFVDGYKWIWQNKLPLHGPVISFGLPF